MRPRVRPRRAHAAHKTLRQSKGPQSKAVFMRRGSSQSLYEPDIEQLQRHVSGSSREVERQIMLEVTGALHFRLSNVCAVYVDECVCVCARNITQRMSSSYHAD